MLLDPSYAVGLDKSLSHLRAPIHRVEPAGSIIPWIIGGGGGGRRVQAEARGAQILLSSPGAGELGALPGLPLAVPALGVVGRTRE